MIERTTTAAADRGRDLLTIVEAATMLRTPVATLRYWRHCGSGPQSFRMGRRVFYRYADLLSWIDTQHDSDPHAAQAVDAGPVNNSAMTSRR